MRLRALVFLLALTAGDYLLWQWSIAGSHDILSLLAGFTLVPLAAVSVGRLVLVCARLLSRVVGQPSATARAAQSSRAAEVARHAPHEPAAKSDSPPGRLAA